MPQKILAWLRGFFPDLLGHSAKARQLRPPKIIQELLRFVRSNLQRFWKPKQQTAIDQRVADDEHEDDWQERYGHRADHHLRFEPRAELISAAFHPKP